MQAGSGPGPGFFSSLSARWRKTEQVKDPNARKLFQAVCVGDAKLVEELLASGASPNYEVESVHINSDS